jgi:mannose-6-phosphate isomerase-like protein (cupin superfamily)
MSNLESFFLKNFVSFEETIDFNFLSKLINRNHIVSNITSNWFQSYILNSVFKIEKVEQDFAFKEIFGFLNNRYNKQKYFSDMHIFFSMVSGGTSTTHRDDCDVFIIGVYGKTFYNIEEEEFTVEKGDLLFIPKNKLHRAIGISPRIILSFGVLKT